MADKRSSTDILLSIESKIDTMARRLQNMENLYKIQLMRMNAKEKTSNQQHVSTPPTSESVKIKANHEQEFGNIINKDNFDNRPKTSKFSEMAAEHGVDVEEGPKHIEQSFKAHRADLSPDPNGEDMVEAPVRQKSRGQRGKQSSGSKSPVSQILNREDGSPLFLANIEVMDQNGTLINQARTNTKGRWLMSLASGSYQVHVTKRFPPDSGRESIDTIYNIDVPPSDGPMELDPLFLGG